MDGAGHPSKITQHTKKNSIMKQYKTAPLCFYVSYRLFITTRTHRRISLHVSSYSMTSSPKMTEKKHMNEKYVRIIPTPAILKIYVSFDVGSLKTLHNLLFSKLARVKEILPVHANTMLWPDYFLPWYILRQSRYLDSITPNYRDPRLPGYCGPPRSLIDAQRGNRTNILYRICLLYTSPSPRDLSTSRMPSSA